MTERVARDPGVMAQGGDEAPPPWRLGDDGAAIGAARCGGCGSVQVPFQTMGCRRCGSTELDRVELPARGRLAASVVVWRHPTRPTPYTLGEIELDGGPTVVALLGGGAAGDDGAYSVGAVVHCTTLTDEDPPLPVFELAERGRA